MKTKRFKRSTKEILICLIEEIGSNLEDNIFNYSEDRNYDSNKIKEVFSKYKHNWIDTKINELVFQDYDIMQFRWDNTEEFLNSFDFLAIEKLKLKDSDKELFRKYIKEPRTTFDGYHKRTESIINVDSNHYSGAVIGFKIDFTIDDLYDEMESEIENKNTKEFKSKLKEILKFSEILRRVCIVLHDMYSKGCDETEECIYQLKTYIAENELEAEENKIQAELTDDVILKNKDTLINAYLLRTCEMVGTNSIYKTAFCITEIKNKLDCLRNSSIIYTGKKSKHELINELENEYRITKNIDSIRTELSNLTILELKDRLLEKITEIELLNIINK